MAALGVAATYAVLLGAALLDDRSAIVAPGPRRLGDAARPSGDDQLAADAAAARVELAAQVLLLAAATAARLRPGPDLTLGFAPLPLLVWAAVRFDERVVAARAGRLRRGGHPGHRRRVGALQRLVGARRRRSTQLAQLYLICVVLIGLPLVKAMRERERGAGPRSRPASASSGATSPSRGCPCARRLGRRAGCASPSATPPPASCWDCAPEELEGDQVEDLPRRRRAAAASLRPPASGLTGWSGPIGVVGHAPHPSRRHPVAARARRGPRVVLAAPDRRHRAAGAAGVAGGRAQLHPRGHRHRQQPDRGDRQRRAP